MKSETLNYGRELLIKLDKIGKEIILPELEKDSAIKGDELRELLRYLQEKKYLKYTLGLFVNGSSIGCSTVELLSTGMEVVLGKRDYFDASEKVSQTIHNQTNVTHSSQFQVAQAGNNSQIAQIIDNSQINILKQLIENDEELDEPRKKKLFDVLEKVNTLKESGESAYNLIKQVGGIALKYVPLFFSLLK